jgi:ferredoxin-NADP reductase
MKAAKFELEFDHKEQLTQEAFEFYFKRPKDLKFEAGQYMKYSADIPNVDDRGSSRYFTISSTPNNKEFITLTTRIIRSSFKICLSEMREGDRIRAFGPLGYFTVDLKSKKEKIFLAGGIGITPYHSVLQTIKNKKNLPNITLFNSWPSASEAVYYKELKEIEKKNKNIKIIYTLTKEMKDGFEEGRIDESMIKKYVQDYKNAEYFIVGSESVEAGLIELVTGMGIPEENIFSENFPGY